jgi:hypothetical protein
MKVLLAGRKEQERMTRTIVEVCEDIIFRDIPPLYVLTAVHVLYSTTSERIEIGDKLSCDKRAI